MQWTPVLRPSSSLPLCPAPDPIRQEKLLDMAEGMIPLVQTSYLATAAADIGQ